MSSVLGGLQKTEIPKQMPHRHGEITALSNALGSVNAGYPADNARIIGPSGTGKTTVSQYTLEQYDRDGDGDLLWRHVDCIDHSTPAAILYQCCQALPDVSNADYTLGSDPKSLYVEALENAKTPFVAILDEAGDVENTKVFAMLHNIDGVAVWVVAHSDEAIMSQVDTTVASRLRAGPVVELDPYSVAELVDILEARLRGTGALDNVTDAALKDIADRAAGNAREALWLLRYALRSAERSGTFTVTPTFVSGVANDAQKDLRGHNLGRLDTEHQVMHDILERRGELSGPELHDALEERMSQSYSYHDRHGYLTKLREYDEVEKRGETRNATYVALPTE
jgi:Cdc6-like AAA superfamily ATPase